MIPTTQWITGLFPTPGWFVEAGAHDGIGDSQTYDLEQLGWKGFCIEASSACASLMRSRRCLTARACLGGKGGELVTFREIHGNAIELSGILGEFCDKIWDRETRPHHDRIVTTITLTSLLASVQAPSRIEFLSLDTEGSELSILSAHDFERFRFLAIQVEHNGVAERQVAIWALLDSRGYLHAGGDGVNDRYVYREGWAS